MPGEGDGPGDGWSGANTHNKADVWYSYITLSDFDKIDYDYPAGGHGDNDDLVDTDPELAGRVKALVPMSPAGEDFRQRRLQPGEHGPRRGKRRARL